MTNKRLSATRRALHAHLARAHGWQGMPDEPINLWRPGLSRPTWLRDFASALVEAEAGEPRAARAGLEAMLRDAPAAAAGGLVYLALAERFGVRAVLGNAVSEGVPEVVAEARALLKGDHRHHQTWDDRDAPDWDELDWDELGVHVEDYRDDEPLMRISEDGELEPADDDYRDDPGPDRTW